MLKPFKFVVQVVVLEVDENENPVDEKVSEQPVVLYGVKALHDFADKLEADLASQQGETE